MALENPLAKHEHESGDLHANPSQLRFDMWSRIRQATDRLQTASAIEAEELRQIVRDSFAIVQPWERYFTFPGPEHIEHMHHSFEAGDYEILAHEAKRLDRLLSELGDGASALEDPFDFTVHTDELIKGVAGRHYFTVLVTESLTPHQMQELREDLYAARNTDDEFAYELLYLDSMEDALAAVVTNRQIQAVWIRGDVKLRSDSPLGFFRRQTDLIQQLETQMGVRLHGPILAEAVRDLRPELDLYHTIEAEGSLASAADQALFNRSFYRREHPAEIHMATLDGVRTRYRTPFFDALKEYARRPIGNFHALPIARGNSVFNSEWIQDMADFYGDQIFMAETSSTIGGLDSLLSPTGSIRDAQEAASRAFGSRETYFATNGTSSSNKIVLQALCHPSDIVLIDRNCHKSHHYGLVMSGARPIYLDAYPIKPLTMYGAVPIRAIKKQLIDLKRAGRLDHVRMLLLTNCTFDGIVYNPLEVMKEVLAIKPDMIFLWDEAWFAFAQLHPTYRRRNGMTSAAQLRRQFDSEGYRQEYAQWKEDWDKLDPADEATWLDHPLLPDPDEAAIRVYSTQSTHKSLSALRQGSMIHQWDEKFASDVEESFRDAYFTHTTTSPNYQILASLDLARRQVELEGFGKFSDALQMALEVRHLVRADPLLSKYFRFLEPKDLIPAFFMSDNPVVYGDASASSEITRILDTWRTDEFVLDPTRLTLHVANTGMTGDDFKIGTLMNKYGIQVNKTGVNSVLFMTNIGTTWSAIDYLMQALRGVAREIDEYKREASPAELHLFDEKVHQLTDGLPPLPDFSRFHDSFRPSLDTPEGDMRSAFFLAYDTDNQEYFHLSEAQEQLAAGRELVASRFITPYPPGFPILVPGQVVSTEIVQFMQDLPTEEIHGYRDDLGLPVFTEEAIDRAEIARQAERAYSHANPKRGAKPPLPRTPQDIPAQPMAGNQQIS